MKAFRVFAIQTPEGELSGEWMGCPEIFGSVEDACAELRDDVRPSWHTDHPTAKKPSKDELNQYARRKGYKVVPMVLEMAA